MADKSDVRVVITADKLKFDRALEEARKGVVGFKGAVTGQLGQIESIFQGAAGSAGSLGTAVMAMANPVTAAAAALAALTYAVSAGTQALIEEETQLLRIQGVLRATGEASGFTADGINKLADEISRATLTSDGDIRKAAATLATYRGVAGEAFEQTLRLAADGAAAFGSFQQAVEAIGRAMQGHEGALGAVEKAGIRFTAAQKEQYDAMRAVGDIAGQQRIVMERLKDAIGGAGAAEAAGVSGATHRLKIAWEDLTKAIGAPEAWQSAIEMAERLAVAVRKVIAGPQGLAEIRAEIGKVEGQIGANDRRIASPANNNERALAGTYMAENAQLRERLELLKVTETRLAQVETIETKRADSAKKAAESRRDQEAKEDAAVAQRKTATEAAAKAAAAAAKEEEAFLDMLAAERRKLAEETVKIEGEAEKASLDAIGRIELERRRSMETFEAGLAQGLVSWEEFERARTAVTARAEGEIRVERDKQAKEIDDEFRKALERGKQASGEIKRAAEKQAEEAARPWIHAYERMQDALVDFIETGKLQFSSFTAILKRMAAEVAAAWAFQQIGGALGISSLGGRGGVFGGGSGGGIDVMDALSGGKSVFDLVAGGTSAIGNAFNAAGILSGINAAGITTATTGVAIPAASAVMGGDMIVGSLAATAGPMAGMGGGLASIGATLAAAAPYLAVAAVALPLIMGMFEGTPSVGGNLMSTFALRGTPWGGGGGDETTPGSNRIVGKYFQAGYATDNLGNQDEPARMQAQAFLDAIDAFMEAFKINLTERAQDPAIYEQLTATISNFLNPKEGNSGDRQQGFQTEVAGILRSKGLSSLSEATAEVIREIMVRGFELGALDAEEPIRRAIARSTATTMEQLVADVMAPGLFMQGLKDTVTGAGPNGQAILSARGLTDTFTANLKLAEDFGFGAEGAAAALEAFKAQLEPVVRGLDQADLAAVFEAVGRSVPELLDLFGTIGAEMKDAAEAQQDAAAARWSVEQVMMDTAATLMQASEGLLRYQQSLLTGPLSALSPGAQFQEIDRQFRQLLPQVNQVGPDTPISVSATGADQAARIQEMAPVLLDAARSYFGGTSTAGYAQVFAMVQAALAATGAGLFGALPGASLRADTATGIVPLDTLLGLQDARAAGLGLNVPRLVGSDVLDRLRAPLPGFATGGSMTLNGSGAATAMATVHGGETLNVSRRDTMEAVVVELRAMRGDLARVEEQGRRREAQVLAALDGGRKRGQR